MKKILILCFITALLIVGCSATSGKIPNRPPDAVGLIYDMDIENQRILVVSDIDNVDIAYEKWFEAGKYAAFFKVTNNTIINDDSEEVDFSSLSKGLKVEIWHTGAVAESYPMQGEASYINIIN